MKTSNTIFQVIGRLIGVSCLIFCLATHAMASEHIKTIGNGDTEEIDTKGFSAEQTKGYEYIKTYCVGCHSQQRIISSLNNWLTLSEAEYSSTLKEMIAKKMRLSNGDITRQASQKIFDFLFSLYRHV